MIRIVRNDRYRRILYCVAFLFSVAWLCSLAATPCERVLFKGYDCFNRVVKKHNIDYWLDYGTLLGAVRDGRHIPWDTPLDVDAAILTRDVPSLLKIRDEITSTCGIQVLHRDDFNIWNYFPIDTAWHIKRAAFRLFVMKYPPCYIDLEEFDLLPMNETYRARFPWAAKDSAGVVVDRYFAHLKREMPLEDFLPSVPCTIDGFQGSCPRNSSRLLEVTYGPTWQTPRRGYKSDDFYAVPPSARH